MDVFQAMSFQIRPDLITEDRRNSDVRFKPRVINVLNPDLTTSIPSPSPSASSSSSSTSFPLPFLHQVISHPPPENLIWWNEKCSHFITISENGKLATKTSGGNKNWNAGVLGNAPNPSSFKASPLFLLSHSPSFCFSVW